MGESAGAAASGRAFAIDPASSTPPYEQLRSGIAEAVRSGELAPGSRLPTVRGLAEELGLAANTVARAYRELEADEVIVTHGRRGSFVAETGGPVAPEAAGRGDGVRRRRRPPGDRPG